MIISGRPTHGTATPVQIPSVIPAEKRACEVFWAEALLPSLTELLPLRPKVVTCPDDSHGQHDVIIQCANGITIGVQVTELTYELARQRQAQRIRFLSDVVACLRQRGLSSPRRLMVNCFVPYASDGRYSIPSPGALVDAITVFLCGSPEQEWAEVGTARLYFEWVDEGAIYVPSEGGIGVNCDLDSLPRMLDMYRDAVSCIRAKKATSRSPWLLIWSKTFWKDSHWFGEHVLRHMQESFKDAPFERVFFMESMDGPEIFDVNLNVHSVKA